MSDVSRDFDTIAESERTIASFMNDEILLTDPSTTLRESAVLLDEASVGLLVVGTRTEVEGVVSERDILGAVATGVDLDATTVAEVETKNLKWATLDTTVSGVVEEMMENYVRHVLVSDDGELVGIVSMRDLFAAFLD